MEIDNLLSHSLHLWDTIEQSSLRYDSNEFKELLSSCQDNFQKLGNKVNELCLFSNNDIIQDIQTSHLPLILIPYYLALIEQKKMDNRKKHLENAKLFFANFISVCDNFELLSENERKQAEKESNEKERRSQLIERTRKEREIKEKIDYLNKRKEDIIKLRGTEAYEGSDEEEIQRELYITQINFAITRTFVEIRMIEQEMPMLEHFEALKRGDIKPSNPLPPKKNPQPPITIFRDHKGELRSKVFQPHWIQPTMSIEEAADIDMKYMVKGGGTDTCKQSDSEDDEESDPDDNELYRKQREWDAWCDDNPSGSGNTTGNIS